MFGMYNGDEIINVIKNIPEKELEAAEKARQKNKKAKDDQISKQAADSLSQSFEDKVAALNKSEESAGKVRAAKAERKRKKEELEAAKKPPRAQDTVGRFTEEGEKEQPGSSGQSGVDKAAEQQFINKEQNRLGAVTLKESKDTANILGSGKPVQDSLAQQEVMAKKRLADAKQRNEIRDSLLKLIDSGKGDSDEANKLRDIISRGYDADNKFNNIKVTKHYNQEGDLDSQKVVLHENLDENGKPTGPTAPVPDESGSKPVFQNRVASQNAAEHEKQYKLGLALQAASDMLVDAKSDYNKAWQAKSDEMREFHKQLEELAKYRHDLKEKYSEENQGFKVGAYDPNKHDFNTMDIFNSLFDSLFTNRDIVTDTLRDSDGNIVKVMPPNTTTAKNAAGKPIKLGENILFKWPTSEIVTPAVIEAEKDPLKKAELQSIFDTQQALLKPFIVPHGNKNDVLKMLKEYNMKDISEIAPAIKRLQNDIAVYNSDDYVGNLTLEERQKNAARAAELISKFGDIKKAYDIAENYSNATPIRRTVKGLGLTKTALNAIKNVIYNKKYADAIDRAVDIGLDSPIFDILGQVHADNTGKVGLTHRTQIENILSGLQGRDFSTLNDRQKQIVLAAKLAEDMFGADVTESMMRATHKNQRDALLADVSIARQAKNMAEEDYNRYMDLLSGKKAKEEDIKQFGPAVIAASPDGTGDYIITNTQTGKPFWLKPTFNEDGTIRSYDLYTAVHQSSAVQKANKQKLKDYNGKDKLEKLLFANTIPEKDSLYNSLYRYVIGEKPEDPDKVDPRAEYVSNPEDAIYKAQQTVSDLDTTKVNSRTAGIDRMREARQLAEESEKIAAAMNLPDFSEMTFAEFLLTPFPYIAKKASTYGETTGRYRVDSARLADAYKAWQTAKEHDEQKTLKDITHEDVLRGLVALDAMGLKAITKGDPNTFLSFSGDATPDENSKLISKDIDPEEGWFDIRSAQAKLYKALAGSKQEDRRADVISAYKTKPNWAGEVYVDDDGNKSVYSKQTVRGSDTPAFMIFMPNGTDDDENQWTVTRNTAEQHSYDRQFKNPAYSLTHAQRGKKQGSAGKNNYFINSKSDKETAIKRIMAEHDDNGGISRAEAEEIYNERTFKETVKNPKYGKDLISYVKQLEANGIDEEIALSDESLRIFAANMPSFKAKKLTDKQLKMLRDRYHTLTKGKRNEEK